LSTFASAKSGYEGDITFGETDLGTVFCQKLIHIFSALYTLMYQVTDEEKCEKIQNKQTVLKLPCAE